MSEELVPRQGNDSIMQVDSGSQLGAVAAVARERYEREAAVMMAKQYPRDENKCLVRIETSCSRPAFADKARYEYPRGGKTVTGASINLARELSRLWGNMMSGLRIIGEDELTAHVQGWAYDLESNRAEFVERRIRKQIQRKDRRTGLTEWIEPDERDLLELIGREGAKCVRNAILALMPPDIIDHAMNECRKTLDRAAAGDLEQNREDTIRGIVSAFARYGVMTPDLEGKIGHSLDTLTPEELGDLRETWRSLKAGTLTAAEAFPRESAADAVQEGLKKAAKKKASKKAKPKEEPTEALSEAEMAESDRLFDADSTEDPG